MQEGKLNAAQQKALIFLASSCILWNAPLSKNAPSAVFSRWKRWARTVHPDKTLRPMTSVELTIYTLGRSPELMDVSDKNEKLEVYMFALAIMSDLGAFRAKASFDFDLPSDMMTLVQNAARMARTTINDPQTKALLKQAASSLQSRSGRVHVTMLDLFQKWRRQSADSRSRSPGQKLPKARPKSRSRSRSKRRSTSQSKHPAKGRSKSRSNSRSKSHSKSHSRAKSHKRARSHSSAQQASKAKKHQKLLTTSPYQSPLSDITLSP